MTFISRLCTSRVPPEAMRALPISCETWVRRCTASRIAASSRSISWRRASMSEASSSWEESEEAAAVSIVVISWFSEFPLCEGSGLIRFRASHKKRAPDPEADRGALGSS